MNQVTHHDFGLFETELLSVDFISFNIKRISSPQITDLAFYFQNLGFNSYQKKLDSNQSRQDINNNNNSSYNQFEVYFIFKIPYQKEIIQLQFPGVSGKQFYKLIKQRSIQWKRFPNPVLSRLDLVYQRISKFNDPISTIDFINSCYIQFQELHSSRNLVSERNKKGLILKIGNRRSSRHYRIYTNQKNNLLRFEAEMKGDLIKDFQDLLITSSFEEHEFESKIAYQFFKYSFEIFSCSRHPDHIDWLINRIRPYQHKNKLYSDKSIINSHYINQFAFQQFQQKLDLITLLQLLMYVRTLDYQTKTLRSNFRQFKFILRDFLNYSHKTSNHYQLMKLKEFFNVLRTNLVIECFTDKSYRMLVTISEAFVCKSEQNIWIIEVWVAEELFDYLHPFLFPNFFTEKLTIDEFHVLFEIVKIFNSSTTRKEFNIQEFLDPYSSNINGTRKKKIKECFIKYLKVLQ